MMFRLHFILGILLFILFSCAWIHLVYFMLHSAYGSSLSHIYGFAFECSVYFVF